MMGLQSRNILFWVRRKKYILLDSDLLKGAPSVDDGQYLNYIEDLKDCFHEGTVTGEVWLRACQRIIRRLQELNNA